MSALPLDGRTVVTTRDTPGRLDDLLRDLGADVVHVPLIEILDPVDGGHDLADALDGLDRADWLVVTSRHGARRVADAVGAAGSGLRLAAVGANTARTLTELTGRAVDLVPPRQTAADLVSALNAVADGHLTVVVAQADRAAPTLVDGLRAAGHTVVAAVAYRTAARLPTDAERRTMLAADAVTFASGSAALAWKSSVGAETPPVVVAIGPTTAQAAATAGLKVTHVAADHDLDGLVREVMVALARTP